MSVKLTDILANTNNRVGALESNDYDDNAPIARITKIYNGIKYTIKVKAVLHRYPVCSENLYCSDSLYI